MEHYFQSLKSVVPGCVDMQLNISLPKIIRLVNLQFKREFSKYRQWQLITGLYGRSLKQLRP